MSHFKPFPPRRPKPASKPLADLVGPCIGTTLGKHGFSEADVLMHWPEIVGAALADHCHPLRLQWRPRARGEAAADPATLVVRVDGASALRLQHMEAVIVDRVNTYLGWRCVGRLALRQGPLPATARRRPPPPMPDPSAARAAERMVGAFDDPALRDALVRLGSRMAHARRPLPES